jgi:hypothetical protein
MEKKKARKIDELEVGDHHYLSIDDECYYLMLYTAGAGYKDSVNSLIFNFKKSPDKKDAFDWKYKVAAIRTISKLFKDVFMPMIAINLVTMVPIPPSKRKGDLLYDDRMTQVLKLACPQGDIRELIVTKKSLESSHSSELRGVARPTLSLIQSNLAIDESQLDNIKNNIILFDDVLTEGAHYLACKNLILERFPNAKIYGMFISRRVRPVEDPFGFD